MTSSPKLIKSLKAYFDIRGQTRAMDQLSVLFLCGLKTLSVILHKVNIQTSCVLMMLEILLNDPEYRSELVLNTSVTDLITIVVP